MFTVAWDTNAISMLAAIWTAAINQTAVTAAADAIDRRLAANPFIHGNPVCEGLYAIEVSPLRVLFEANTVARSVIVVSVNWLP